MLTHLKFKRTKKFNKKINENIIAFLATSLQDLHKNYSLEIGEDLSARNILISEVLDTAKFIDFEESSTLIKNLRPMTDDEIKEYIKSLLTKSPYEAKNTYLKLTQNKDISYDYSLLAKKIFEHNLK